MSNATENCKKVIELCRLVNGTAPSGVSLTWQSAPGSLAPWSASAGGVTAVGMAPDDAIDVLVMALRQRLQAQLAEAKAQVAKLQEVLG